MSHRSTPRESTVKLTTAALALLVVALAAVTVWTSLDVSRSSSRANADLELGVIYQDIRAAVADEGAAGQAYRDDPAGARLRLRKAQGRLRSGVAELRRRGTRGDRAIAPYIVADELRYQWAARELFAAVDRADEGVAERTFGSVMAPAYRNIQQLVDLAARVHRDRALEATSGVTRRSGRFAALVSLAYVAGFLLLGACAWFLLRMQATLRDLAARQHHLARHDPLTGLPNRRLWHELAGTWVTADEPSAVLIFDLDAFKHVNDTLGHDQGDALLKIVAERLTGALRTDDVVARMGGDEFAVLLPATDRAGASAVVGAIQAALERPCRLRGLELRPHGSAGVAVAPEHGTDVDTLLKHADRAMYAAKGAGTGWMMFSDEMGLTTARQPELLRDLRVAIDEGQLSLRFQPIVSVPTGETVVVEALVRWEHPVHGMLPPDDFIPLAESSGLIVPLGRRVLREACAQAEAWAVTAPDRPPIVSVNLSPRQLLDPGLVGDVRTALVDHHLPAARLMLEITETSVMEEPETATARLEELSALGVRLAVDDFGTGHSSLAYLRRLPLTDLKLARPFVRDLEDSPANVKLARGIIGLAHALELRVIAEGIESAGQLERLRGMGCDLAQGFLFARPLPSSELRRFLRCVPAQADDPTPVTDLRGSIPRQHAEGLRTAGQRALIDALPGARLRGL